MTIIYGIIILSFLVFFHELGHFLAAKACGVKVEAFSVGMGPVLLHKKIGYTDYRLSLIPIGGYCSMKGEKDFQEALELNLKEINSSKDSFYGVHPLKRLLISFAGPFFNLLLAFTAYLIIALMGYSYYTAGTRINLPSSNENYRDIPSPAEDAGLLNGDEIIEINGTKMEDFRDISNFITLHGDEDLKITVQRNSQLLTFTVHSLLDRETGSGKIGILSDPESIQIKQYESRSFFPAVLEGVKRVWKTTKETVYSLRILFKGVKLSNTVSGPIRISSMVGENVDKDFKINFSTGILNLLNLIAVLNISLFLMNLLPVPVFDGGHIIFSLIEMFSGRKTNPKALYYLQIFGLILIGALFVLALTGDIQYFINMKR